MKTDEICAVKAIEYQASDTIETQGKQSTIKRYLEAGYHVKEERNGYWVLIKKARVIVTLQSSAGTQVINLRRDILDYYGKKRITPKQVEKFVQDIKKEKVAVCCDVNGDYLIKKVKARKQS